MALIRKNLGAWAVLLCTSALQVYVEYMMECGCQYRHPECTSVKGLVVPIGWLSARVEVQFGGACSALELWLL